MNDFRNDRSVGSLLRELSRGTSTLFREEVALAKAEASQKIAFLQNNARKIAIGGALLFAGLVLLVTALNRGFTALLANWMSVELAVWIAPLVLGSTIALTGFALTRSAMDRIGREGLRPERTLRTLEEDKRWLEQKVK